MKNLLKGSSFIRVAIIIVVMAFMAGQVTDTYARGWGNYGLKRYKSKQKIKKIIVEIIKKHHHECPECPETPTDCNVCPPPEGVEKSWVAKTGQTPTVPLNPAPTGSDGDLEKGITWPIPRFTINEDDVTVTDNLTCLMWDRDADGPQSIKRTWADALNDCGTSTVGGHNDWRLPNIGELQSLVHYGVDVPAVPNTAGTGQWTDNPTPDPFSDVQSSGYWSSTTTATSTTNAWYVYFNVGSVTNVNKTASDTYGVYEAGRDA